MLQLVSKKIVADMLNVKPEALDNLPNFPKKIKLSDSRQARVRYDLNEVNAWVERRKIL